jgi:hypothetical protein
MPVSRGRKRTKKSTESVRPSDTPALLPVPDSCSCPACSGEDFDPQGLVDELTADAADLLKIEDPLEAEMFGALVVSIGDLVDEGFEETMVSGLLPALETRASAEVLAMLLAIGAVVEDPIREATSAATERLLAAGVAKPGWAAELDEPVTVGECWHLSDQIGIASVLACTFHRAGRSHGILLSVDHLRGGGASQISLVDADQFSDMLEEICAEGREDGVELAMQSLDPADFRERVDNALTIRAVLDRDDADIDPYPEALGDSGDDEDDLPNYWASAALLRVRMTALPSPPHHTAATPLAGPSPREMLAQLAQAGGNGFDMASFGKKAATLPPKRKKGDGPAPVYQIKVGLRGAKPPIWRRLEVPANISLARLHRVIQAAFGWTDSHLHAFETPYGDFGVADPGIGHRAEAPVSLEQVAHAEKSKIRYTYDFGDNWEHEITVEKILPRQKKTSYPRCTGGRRAAPPEDCGGIYGYADLMDVLANPDHPEHQEHLEWLGLNSPAKFDPAAFDVQTVNHDLTEIL